MRHAAMFEAALTLALLVGASADPPGVVAQHAAAVLVAAVYPGAVSVEGLSGQTLSDGMRAFLSRDAIEDVKGFYDRDLGPMVSASLSDLRVPEELRDASFGSRAFVFAREVARGGDSGVLGVQLSVPEPSEELGPHQYPAVGPIFERLQMGVGTGDATQAQFDRLVTDYGFLAWRYYAFSEEQVEPGQPRTADEVVFQACETRAGGGMDPDELSAEMESLYQQGKFDEAAEMGERMMGAAGATSWDDWVACLEQLEPVG